jgi:hypothetical protein
LTQRKNGTTLLGVEDGSFNAFSRDVPQYAFLCGATTRGDRITAIQLTEVEVDGLDATDGVLEMLGASEVDAVILGGVTFAGFNLVDPWRVYEETAVPVIVYSGDEPDNEAVLSALKKHFSDWEIRWSIIEGLGEIHRTRPFPDEPPIYFEKVGCERGWVEEVLKGAAVISRIPEPVRVAGLVAKGLSRIS